jgi:hypothetical protein
VPRSQTCLQVLSPYVDRLVESLFVANIDFDEVKLESLSEVLGFRIKLTIRQMDNALQAETGAGRLKEPGQFMWESPEAGDTPADRGGALGKWPYEQC